WWGVKRFVVSSATPNPAINASLGHYPNLAEFAGRCLHNQSRSASLRCGLVARWRFFANNPLETLPTPWPSLTCQVHGRKICPTSNDRPNHFPLPHRREAGRRRNGRGLQGGGHRPWSFRGPQVPARRFFARPASPGTISPII